jgi:hypothetical protein
MSIVSKLECDEGCFEVKRIQAVLTHLNVYRIPGRVENTDMVLAGRRLDTLE